MREIPGVEFHGGDSEAARYVELITSLSSEDEEKLLREIEHLRQMIRQAGGMPLFDAVRIAGVEMMAILTYPENIVSYAPDAPVDVVICFRETGEELLHGGPPMVPAGPKPE